MFESNRSFFFFYSFGLGQEGLGVNETPCPLQRRAHDNHTIPCHSSLSTSLVHVYMSSRPVRQFGGPVTRLFVTSREK